MSKATELLTAPDRSPCVRFYRRPDGRVLTSDCPAGLRTRLWRRLHRRAAWLAPVFALLALPACQSLFLLQGAKSGYYSPKDPDDDMPQVEAKVAKPQVDTPINPGG